MVSGTFVWTSGLRGGAVVQRVGVMLLLGGAGNGGGAVVQRDEVVIGRGWGGEGEGPEV